MELAECMGCKICTKRQPFPEITGHNIDFHTWSNDGQEEKSVVERMQRLCLLIARHRRQGGRRIGTNPHTVQFCMYGAPSPS